MKRAKIITLSVFLILCNYADGMNVLLRRYIPSKTVRKTKKPIKPKKVFSPKKIHKKFYTTENSPEKESFWQNRPYAR